MRSEGVVDFLSLDADCSDYKENSSSNRDRACKSISRALLAVFSTHLGAIGGCDRRLRDRQWKGGEETAGLRGLWGAKQAVQPEGRGPRHHGDVLFLMVIPPFNSPQIYSQDIIILNMRRNCLIMEESNRSIPKTWYG